MTVRFHEKFRITVVGGNKKERQAAKALSEALRGKEVVSHFKTVCKKCKTVITQCRCPSKDKEIRYEVCAKCQKKAQKDK